NKPLGGVWSLVRIQSPRLVKSIDNLMIVDAFLFLYFSVFPHSHPHTKTTKSTYINSQTDYHILRFPKRNHTFPMRKTYSSALRNVGFAQGKHKNHLYTFPFTPLSFTEL
ncbi:hypothetical protein, partial [Phocaeicola plebeius]|uniref:hypothetical protein n=1 Tax=Phocaeicola plebeius TaxID=310297 RepID=UPI0026EA27C9